MFSFPISEWIRPKCGYMLKKIVFSSFYHPFQDGYKSSIIQILFPWLVQGWYLNCLPQYFLYARTVTKCWCSVGMFFDRCTNFKFTKWYPDVTIWILVHVQCFLLQRFWNIIIQAGIFKEYWNKCFWRTTALEKAPAQFIALRILSGKGEVQIMPFRKISGKCHFLLRFCARNWSETYIHIYIQNSYFHLQYEHDYTDSGMFPDQTTSDASDGCRNPALDFTFNPTAADQTAPWCFTTSSQEEWEHCHQLPLCDCKKITTASSVDRLLLLVVHA